MRLTCLAFGVEYNHLFTVLLQELSVDLDDDILFQLFEFLNFQGDIVTKPSSTPLGDVSLSFTPPKLDEGELKMYFETFLLHPLLINLSYSRTAGNQVDDDKIHQRNLISFFVEVLTMTVGNIHVRSFDSIRVI